MLPIRPARPAPPVHLHPFLRETTAIVCPLRTWQKRAATLLGVALSYRLIYCLIPAFGIRKTLLWSFFRTMSSRHSPAAFSVLLLLRIARLTHSLLDHRPMGGSVAAYPACRSATSLPATPGSRPREMSGSLVKLSRG